MESDDRREVRTLAREFAERELRPRAARWDRERALDDDVLAKLGELGFLGMLTPPDRGGLGLDVADFLVALEEIARGDASVALAMAIQNGPVPRLLLDLGSDEQAARWLPGLAAGERIAGWALAEGEAGVDPAWTTTTATRRADGGWVVDGAKRWVANGRSADWVLVFARTRAESADASPPVGAFLVDTASEGYRTGPRKETAGLRAFETVDVRFDGVRVDADRLVGDESLALVRAEGALDLERLGLGMQAVGVARAALEHALSYARQRRQFGRAIASFGAVRGKLARMATEIAAARALALAAAAVLDGRARASAGDPSSTPPTAAMARLFAARTAASATEEAVRIFGGYGFMSEYPVEKLMRDAQASESQGETSEALQWTIERRIPAGAP